jgi:hypothetical protein
MRPIRDQGNAGGGGVSGAELKTRGEIFVIYLPIMLLSEYPAAVLGIPSPPVRIGTGDRSLCHIFLTVMNEISSRIEYAHCWSAIRYG